MKGRKERSAKGHNDEGKQVRHIFKKALGTVGWGKRLQKVEKRLQQTKELLDARSAELSGTQSFLSTADGLSEAEVLDTVRELNENIYQVAVRLTEGWEKLESSQATVDIDPISQAHVPASAQLVRNWDPTGLTPLLQSCLCSQVVDMTSGWGHDQESAVLEPIYQRLCASGEYRMV